MCNNQYCYNIAYSDGGVLHGPGRVGRPNRNGPLPPPPPWGLGPSEESRSKIMKFQKENRNESNPNCDSYYVRRSRFYKQL